MANTDPYLKSFNTAGKDQYLKNVVDNANYSSKSVNPAVTGLNRKLEPYGYDVGSLFRQLDINATGPYAEKNAQVMDMIRYMQANLIQTSSDEKMISNEDRMTNAMLISSFTGRDLQNDVLPNLDQYTKFFTGVDTDKSIPQSFKDHFEANDIQKEINNLTLLLLDIPYDDVRRPYYEDMLAQKETAYATKTADVSNGSGFWRKVASSGNIVAQSVEQIQRSLVTQMLVGGLGGLATGLMSSGVTGIEKMGNAMLVGDAMKKASAASAIGYTASTMMKGEASEIAKTLLEMVDEDGNRIPLDIIKEQAYSWGLISAFTEMADDFITPIGNLKLGNKTLGETYDAIKDLIKSNPAGYVGLGVGSTAFQAGQEGLQGYLRQRGINAAVRESNSKGFTNIPEENLKTGWNDSWNVVWDEFKESFIPMGVSQLLTGAVSAGATFTTSALSRAMQVTPQMNKDANRYFSSDKGRVFDIGFIDTVGADPVDHYAPKTDAKTGEKQEPKKASPIIMTVNAQTGAYVPVYARDRQYLEFLRTSGVTGVRGIVISEQFVNKAGNTASASNLANTLALMIGEDNPVMGYDGNAIIMETQDGVEAAAQGIENYRAQFFGNPDAVEISKQKDGSYRIMWETESGKARSVTIRVKADTDAVVSSTQTEEGEAQTTGNVNPVRQAPTEGFGNMFSPLIHKSLEQAYEDDETEYAAKYFYSQLTGMTMDEIEKAWREDYQSIMEKLPEGVGETTIEEGARFMPLLSAVTGKSTQDLLNDPQRRIVLSYGGKARMAQYSTGERGLIEGGFNEEYDEDSKTWTYRINLTDAAGGRATALVHELMHVARAMASPEKLSGFVGLRGYTSFGGAMWRSDIVETKDGKYRLGDQIFETRKEARNMVEANEEQFVRDFFEYLRTGDAPNTEVASFFNSLKQFLQRFRIAFSDKFSQETKEAFDRLLSGEVEVQPGQTIEEAVEASDATLTDEVPQWEANDYSDEEMFDEEGNPLYSLSPEAQRQYDDVVAKYKDTDQWLKAPNGKYTNLTERQWVQVRTQNFLDWFGDWLNDPENASKILDENGEPKVVYHGSPYYGFDTFDTMYDWAWFSETAKFAEGYADTRYDARVAEDVDHEYDDLNKGVYSVFLNIRNPIDISDYYAADGMNSAEFVALLNERTNSDDFNAEMFPSLWESELDPTEIYEYWMNHTDFVEKASRKAVMEGRKAYDGLIVREDSFGDDLTFGVWEPNKIKSATDNNGEFSNENNSILYSLADDKQWQVMDANTQRRIDADYDYVRNQFFGTDKWMKAPNGQPTKLTERQWVQVRTPAFKQWFGDWENDPENASKIVDENGEPVVVWHGTKMDFETFDVDRSHNGDNYGKGIYAGQIGVAEEFSKRTPNGSFYGSRGITMPLFLNIRNPFVDYFSGNDVNLKPMQLTDMTPVLDILRNKGLLSEFGYRKAVGDRTAGNLLRLSWGYDDSYRDSSPESREWNGVIDYDLRKKEINEAVREAGFDGIVGDLPDFSSSQYVAFSPNQVKSAADNTGAFSTEDDNILHSIVYHGSGADFDEFLESKIGSGQGSQSFGYGFYFSESDLIGKDYAQMGEQTLDTNNQMVAQNERHLNYWQITYNAYKEKKDASEPNSAEQMKWSRAMESAAQEIEYYKKEIEHWKNRETRRRNLYKVEIPDSINGAIGTNYGSQNYIVWDRQYPMKDLKQLSEELKKRLPKEDADRFDEYSGFMPDQMVIGSNLYGVITDYLGSQEAASDFLADMGYEGITYKAGQMMGLPDGVSQDTWNYVIFPKNKSHIKMVNHWTYDTDEEAERLYSIRPDTYSEVADYISTMPEAERDRIFRNLEQFKGSPWYYQTLSAALVRRDMESLINGEGIPSDSFLYKASRSKDGTYAVIEALKNGPEGVFGYVQSHSLVANSEKALFAINGSTLDCNPTPECAQFCYVTNGQMAYPISIIKAEMVALAIRLDPVRAARMAAIQYKYQAGYDTKLVMRMFDRGDFSAEYVPFIKELNKQGVGVQIFTKRPDFLYEIDRQRNVVMMSVDHSNVDMIEKYPDLPIAVVYQGKEDVPMIESLEKRFKEHKGVILPVKIGREYVSEEDIMALPQWARVKFTCNIDRGLKTINNWNCRKCDLNGINGCFFERGVKDREMVGRSIEDMSIGEIYDIIGSLKDRNDATKELIGRGINLWDPRFGRVLDELLALRNRELEGSLGGATAQTGTEPSPDTGGEPEVASGRGLVEDHNGLIEDFAKDNPEMEVSQIDGLKYVKTDPSFDYSEDYLRSIKDEESRQLDLFDTSGYGDQPELPFTEGIPGRVGGTDSAGLRPGIKKYFSFRYGWNKQEPAIPSINQQWDNLGYIDFTNTRIRGYRDLAKLWSIYRNPLFEYFHIVFTKDDRIVGSLALSSGVAGRTIAILSPNRNEAKVAERMAQYGADGYYLLHNHPSGDTDPSPADRQLTQMYKMHIPGFKGHIILDHNKYSVISGLVNSDDYRTTGFHEVSRPKENKAFQFSLSNSDFIDEMARSYMKARESGTNLVYLRFYGGNAFAVPESIIPYNRDTMSDEEILSNPQARFSTWAMVFTDNYDDYSDLVQLEKNNIKRAVSDIIYVDRKNGFWVSAFLTGKIPNLVDSKGDTVAFGDKVTFTKRKKVGDDYFNPVFETGNDTLFSLSPERKAEVLEQRKREIQRAVEAGIFVSTEYLNEFRGEDWVQSELELRDWMNANPDVVAMAKASSSVENFKKKYLGKPAQDNDDIPFDESGLFDDDEIPFTEPEDEEQQEIDAPSDTWFEKIYQYAHALSSADRDRQFAAEWTATEDKTLELANTLRSYMDAFFNAKPNSRKGGYWYTRTVYGAFKGVSQKVRMLRDGKSRKSYQRERSSSEEIREAQELIRQNPRPYRNAYMTAMMAESRAAQVRAGEQTGIGEDADWMRLEMIDDDIAQEMEKLESESTAAKKPKTDYSTKYEDLKKKLRDAERDLQKANENSRTTIGNLRSQLDLANAKVDALQKQLREDEADLQNAEKEYSDLIERLGGKIADLQEDNAELRAEKSRARKLEKQLEERRNRVKELRNDLTAANRETRRLQNALDASRRYIEARKASEYRNKRLRQIRNLATFNPDTQDASFEESFDWVLGLFIRDEGDMEIRKDLDSRIAALKARIEQSRYSGENVDAQKQELLELRKQKRQSRMLEAPAQLALYLPQGYEVRADNRPSMWSAEELDILLRAVQLMRMDAKAMLADKNAARDSSLNSVAYKYFRQASGREGQLNEYGEMSSRALIEDILSQPEKTFGKGAEKLLSYHLYKAKIQRLARIVDGDSEGVVYDWFVRRSYRNQTKELSEVNRRLALGDKVWKELGLKHGELAKEGFRGQKENGTEYSLTRGQMIGVYIYSKSELGYEKLTSISGNGITEDDVENISNALTDKERAWAEFLLSEMDGNWQRLADTYYLVWNRNLGRREAYFPLVSAVALHSEDTDFLCGENINSKDGKSYVDKGFTKEVNPNAIYPLNLDATATWNKQVRRQEHFVAYGEWARDTQRLLDGGRGMLGAEIKQIYGEPYYHNIQRQADHVISNYITTGTGFDTVFGKYFSARNAAALTASFSTMFKQLGSIGAIFETGSDFSTVFAGERYFRNFLLANEELNSEFGEVGNVREFIYQNAPDIRNRKIDHEVMAYMNRVYGGAVSNAIQKVTGKVMEYTTNACDRLVVERLWLAKYYTEFGALREQGQSVRKAHEEAVFKASQLISETQPTSMRMDQSGMQIEAQKNSLLRMIAVFTNQAMNIENMVMFDIPLAFRQKNWKKVAQVAAAVAVNVGFVALVSGRFVKKGDEDDDKYAMRLIREILATVASTVDPVFGGNLASGILYGSQGQDYLAEFNDIGEAVRKMLTPSDRKTAWERISAAMEAIASEAAGAAGIPAGNVLKRPIQAVTEKNPGYLINSTWGQIVESYR